MTDEQKAAYVIAQSVSAFARICGMHAENRQREATGFSLAYGEEAFAAVPDEFGLGHNSVVGLFHD
jgi:hypothetical protein